MVPKRPRLFDLDCSHILLRSFVHPTTAMCKKDGRRRAASSSYAAFSKGVEGGHETCSRWEELQECIDFHARLAEAAGWETEFRLINPPGGTAAQVVCVGTGGRAGVGAQGVLRASMRTEPRGKTPLCTHLRHVHREIVQRADALRENGCKAIVVIATDGKTTDGDLGEVLRSFQDLPVWLVVRLCTDDDDIVEYWGHLDDGSLHIGIDVLDDFENEAVEVTQFNPWLNYSCQLHRARESGLQVSLRLTKGGGRERAGTTPHFNCEVKIVHGVYRRQVNRVQAISTLD